jgi:hypothetical protein
MDLTILSWNCNGAFRKKFEYIIDYDAGICIIQECEDPTKSNDEGYKKWQKVGAIQRSCQLFLYSPFKSKMP